MKDANYKIKRKEILSYLRGQYNPEGKKILNQWFLEKEKSLSALNNYSDDELINISIRLKTGIEARINGEESDLKSLRLKSTRSEVRFLNRWSYMVASVALFAILSTILFQQLHKKTDHPEENLSFYQVRHVPHGEKLKLELTDGSIIFLNSGSEFRFPAKFNSETREVYLKGEAYFEIAEMPEKPFIVHTSGLKTTVIGTSFNIKSFDDDANVFVTVVNGEVQVEIAEGTLDKSGMSANLVANEQAMYSRTIGNIRTSNVSSLNYISWKENVLRFDNLSLAEIAVTLERWFDVQIKFKNDGLKNCYFMGRHENPKLYNILEAISYATGMQWEIEDGNIWLNGNGCSPQ